jgi:GYF domain 2
MAEVQWWYARGDDQLGPVSPADLRRLAAGGNLAPADLVWREGMAEWAPAARIKGLFPDAREAAEDGPPPTAPPPPAAAPVDAPAGEAPSADPTGMTASMPEGLFPPEPDEAEMFAGEQAVVEPPPAGPIESGLFRTPSASDISASFPPAGQAQRPGRTRVPLVLLLAQGALWGTCGLVVLLGGLLFTVSRIRGTSSQEEAASATVLGMFFIGVYVVAQAGEKISKLVMALIERRRNE